MLKPKINASDSTMLFVQSKAILYEQGFVPTLGGLIHMLTPAPSLLIVPSKIIFHISFSAWFFGLAHFASFHAISSSFFMVAARSSSSKLRSL
jgi:hypothetical protein